jgi:anti-anti-sigma factor
MNTETRNFAPGVEGRQPSNRSGQSHLRRRTGVGLPTLDTTTTLDNVATAASVVFEAHLKATVVTYGAIDISNAARLENCLQRCLARGNTHITVDMTELSFIDCRGVSALASTVKQLRSRGGRLVVRNPPYAARKALEITGLTDAVAIEDHRRETGSPL